jgi:hypothetical protein
MQLLTVGEVEAQYPQALILSEDTGHRRNYNRNPYAGYETNNQFAFEPSELDTTLPPKEIMVVFRDREDTPTAISWKQLREQETYSAEASGMTYNFIVDDSNQLTIRDDTGTTYPFYFEMWFSFAVQHDDEARVITIE